VLGAVGALPAHALGPTEVFEKVSASVWTVRALDDAERPFSQGSAVVIGPGRLVTNCHVLVKAVSVQVRRENVTYDAKLEHADPGRDLCILQVAKFEAPAVEFARMDALKVGQRVFAVGTPRGMESTLSEGLISGLRTVFENPRLEKVSSEVIQTTAPISPGSSGGGLFDDNGRLVGITSLVRLNAQNINYALPADWIAAVPERAQALLARREAARKARAQGAAGAALPASPGYPAAGTVWVYRFLERLFSERSSEITIRVAGVYESVVEEIVTAKGSRILTERRAIDGRTPGLVVLPLRGENMIELAPYLLAETDGKPPPEPLPAIAYPESDPTMSAWLVESKMRGWEDLTVHAGSFKAWRVLVEGRRLQRPQTNLVVANRFVLEVWYSPDVKRIVRLEHKVWSNSGTPMADDLLELTSYRPPS
jgi:hypothetical protein